MPRDEVLFYTGLPRLEIDGQEDDMAADMLVSLQMTESEGGMSSVELCFENAATLEDRGLDMPFESDANDKLKLGAEIRVVAGDTHDPQEVFQGLITGVELVMDGAEAPKLNILAEDALQSARLKRRSKLHEVDTLDDLVNAVARESGLQVTSAGLTQPIGLEVQANETDLGFLRRICARFDVDFQIVERELHISPRSVVDRGSRPLEFGETLTSFRALADLADQVSGVSFTGWDDDSGQPFQVTGGPGADWGPGQGRKGGDLIAEIFGERVEHVGGMAVHNTDQAQAAADAMLAARRRRFVSAEGTVTGDPGLRVGTVVEISGVGARFTNAYYVTHCQHRYARGDGYMTDFRAETAFFGG